MDLGLDGRCYVLTGASRGLGLATARVLVAEGATVVISGRHPGAAERAAEELGGAERARGLTADNADPGTAGRLVAAAQQAFGRLDGALISVGGPPPGGALDTSDAAWREAFESVFLGAVRIAREVAGALTGQGAIGFVLSSSVKSPIGGLAISNGLRPGLAMVAKTLADELGPQGLRVLSFAPGRIATDRILALDTGDEEVRRRAESSIPLGRYGDPAEFGRLAAFCLSPAASYLSGCVIPVDGGAGRSL
jgi:3-oxoacyl-[acyl-carrier protein] reductase